MLDTEYNTGMGMGMGTMRMFVGRRNSNGSFLLDWSLVIERNEPVADPFDVYEIKCHAWHVRGCDALVCLFFGRHI